MSSVSLDVNIFNELKEIRTDIKDLTICMTKCTSTLEELVEKTKQQEEKIGKFSRFKNKLIGIFSGVNFVTVLTISLFAILL